MKERAVLASSLCKEYRIGDLVIEALKDLDLEMAEGEFVVVHGPSGAGKTTLLNLIGGLDRPTAGKIVVLGQDLGAKSEESLAAFRSANVGFVFQSYNLISTLTALENVAFPIELAAWPEEEAQKRIETRPRELLRMVGLSHRADHLPAQLSGGEQQRVAFARALANDPPIILADEPTGNLDLETGLEVVRILEGLRAGGKTVVAATHDERIWRLADRRMRLEGGRIVEVEE